MKRLLFFLLFFSINAAFGQPVITSFSPSIAVPGTTVVLSGSGFSTNTLDNIIYFGAVKANVTVANANSITVTVPLGATYDLISATVSNLTAYSSKKFLPITSGTEPITTTTFFPKQDYISGNFVHSVAVADFDGDGRGDIVAANYSDATISIFKNSSIPINFALATKIDYVASSNPGDIKTGDINGDGKPDIVTANDISKTVSVFINTSTTNAISFAPKQDFSTGTYAVAIAIGDIDGDGKPDLIELNNQDNNVSVLRNISTGSVLSFASRVNAATGVSGSKVMVIDMEEDGKQDIVVTNQFSASVSIIKNSSVAGTILLNPKVDFSVSSQARGIDIGDVNDDNKPDIVTGGSDTSISVLTNTSTGSGFSFTRQDIRIGISPVAVVLGDINGDGKPDIAIAGSEINIAVIENTSTAGATSFSPKVEYPMQGSSSCILIADINNDSKNDIIVGSFNRLSLLRNRVLEPIINSFTPTTGTRDSVIIIKGQKFTGTTGVSFGITPAASFSVQNDSTIVAVLGLGNSGYVSVTKNFATGISSGYFSYYLPRPVISSFTPESGPAGTIVTIKGRNFISITSTFVRFGGTVARITDFNSFSDTLMKVRVPLAATYEPITVTTYNGGTAYSAKLFTVTFPGGEAALSSNSFAPRIDSVTLTGPAAVTLGDFDGNERLDIAVANYNANSISVYQNRSDSVRISFVPKVSFATGAGPKSIVAADLDIDGRLDAVVANSLSNTISVFRNLTLTTVNFTNKMDFATPGTPVALKVGDLNMDGKPDIAVLCRSGYLSIFKNGSVLSLFNFSPRIDSLTGSFPTDLALADLDQDGKQDIIIADSISGNIIIYKNTSTANSFSFVKTTVSASNHLGLATTDINKDGKPDLIATNRDNNNITLYINQTIAGGAFSFQSQQYPAAFPNGNVSVADVNGDGQPDIVVTSLNTSAISVLKNTTGSTISFDAAYPYTTGIRPSDIVIGDLDGDSKPEIITSNFGSNTLSVFRNQIGEIIRTNLCPGGGTALVSNIVGTSYQWQVNNGSGYMPLAAGSNYSGVNTNTLVLSNIPSAYYGYKYRCMVGSSYSDEYVIKFKNTWVGNSSNSWENPVNWSCGVVPDANTDVVISSGSVVLNSNTSCGSVIVTAPATLMITTGYTLTITR